MEKLIAFDLYRKNELGGHSPALSQSKNTAGFSVYLAADVDNEIRHLTRQRDETFEKLKAAEARIQALTFGSNSRTD